MEEIKKTHESKTIISATVGLVCSILLLLGYTDISQASVEQIVTNVVIIISSALAIYGRVVADKKIQ